MKNLLALLMALCMLASITAAFAERHRGYSAGVGNKHPVPEIQSLFC